MENSTKLLQPRRISSTDPNLQTGANGTGNTDPKDLSQGGRIFVDGDYSQIELRVLAHCSGDQALIDAYREGEKHS